LLPGGSLAAVLSTSPPPSWWTSTTKSKTAVGLALGRQCLQLQAVLYRDLKPNNILFNERRRIRICDFGAGNLESLGVRQTNTVGTPFYIASEQCEPGYDDKVDVYSFALILSENVTGGRVYPVNYSMLHVYRASLSGNRPEISQSVSRWFAI
jgi:serine/threonine protein kinase